MSDEGAVLSGVWSTVRQSLTLFCLSLSLCYLSLCLSICLSVCSASSYSALVCFLSFFVIWNNFWKRAKAFSERSICDALTNGNDKLTFVSCHWGFPLPPPLPFSISCLVYATDAVAVTFALLLGFTLNTSARVAQCKLPAGRQKWMLANESK